MLDKETVEQLRHAPIGDRIQAIEILLQSLKHDFTTSTPPRKTEKKFAVRTFDLGSDISVDREEMYMERSIV